MNKDDFGRIMSIDYGLRRVGLAVTDPTRRIATRLCTIQTERALDFLQNYAKKEPVQAFVIGLPVSLVGTETDATAPTRAFAAALGRCFPKLPLYWIDERFSSVEAKKALRSAGLPKHKRAEKGLIDGISAVLLLQSHLDRCHD